MPRKINPDPYCKVRVFDNLFNKASKVMELLTTLKKMEPQLYQVHVHSGKSVRFGFKVTLISIRTYDGYLADSEQYCGSSKDILHTQHTAKV